MVKSCNCNELRYIVMECRTNKFERQDTGQDRQTYKLYGITQRVKEVDFKMDLEKCQFWKREVKYLGHVIDKKGDIMDP